MTNREPLVGVATTFLALCAVGSVAAQDTQTNQVYANCNSPGGTLYNALVPFNTCMKSSALRLEPSKGSPSDINDAALTECATSYAEVTRIADACSRYYSYLQIAWNGKAIIDANTKSTVAQIVLSKRAAEAVGQPPH